MTSNVGPREVCIIMALPKPVTGREIHLAVQAVLAHRGSPELTEFGQNHPTDKSLAFFGQYSPHPNQQVAVQSFGASAPYFKDGDERHERVIITSHAWPTWCWREDADQATKVRAVQTFAYDLRAALQ